MGPGHKPKLLGFFMQTWQRLTFIDYNPIMSEDVSILLHISTHGTNKVNTPIQYNTAILHLSN